MLTDPEGAYPLAIDVGTSAVRLWTPGLTRVITEPAAVAFGPDGSRRAAGHAAVALTGRTGVEVVWPVRQGVVDNVTAAAHLLHAVIAMTGRPRDDRSPVLVGVPATATVRERDLLLTAVRRTVHGPVVTVAEPLAAALACHRDGGLDGADVVAVDIGHGRTEVVKIVDRAVAAAERIDVTTMVDQVPAIAGAVRRMTARGSAPPRRRLLITGAGATIPGTAAELAARTGRAVTVPGNATLATLTGLRRLLTS